MTDELTEAQRKRLEQLARLCPLTLSLSQADGDAIRTLLAALDQRDAEVERLRLAICGGEDAPGYAMSLPLETILQVQDDNRQTWKRDSELAWDGETANSWKARAQAAEQEVKRLRTERDAACDERDDYRDRLRDVVMIDAEEWALSGGGPGIRERREKAWTRAREPFEP